MREILFLFLFPFVLFSQDVIKKEIGDFNSVKVFNGISVDLIPSENQKVEITGENREDIIVKNKNGKVKIYMKINKSFKGAKNHVRLYYKRLTIIDANEGSFITCDKVFKQNNLELRAQEGAEMDLNIDINFLKVKSVTGGIILLKGFANTQDITINSGGKYIAKELDSKNSEVNVTAGGIARIKADEFVKASVKMGGQIYLYKKPKELEKKKFLGGKIEYVK